MRQTEKYAIDAAKEITIALLQNTQAHPNKAGGENVGDFFQAVYSKVLEIAKEVSDN